MKDIQDNVRDDSNDAVNDAQERMEQTNDQAGQNGEESQYARTEIPEEKEQDSGEPQESAPAEGQAAQAEKEVSGEDLEKRRSAESADTSVLNTEEQNGAESNTSQKYSCSYQPPYYVPNITVEEEDSSKTRKGHKKSVGVGLIAAVVVIALIVSVVGGSVGYLCMNWLDREPTPNGENGGGADSMTVIKNDGSIQVNEAVGSTGYSNLEIREVVDLVADSVVEITTSQVQTDFFGQYVTGGAGSGVIVDQNGYIITNHHVIEGADEILVRLKNGTEYTATLVGADEETDVAVLKVEATGLPFATLGSSASLKVGEGVVAIGNPLGELGGTVTDGIISALDRNVIVDGHRMSLLQTNAAINPGNSGGGLFNRAGELVGIVNAKQSQTGIEGLGFAIPIDVAWSAAKDIMQYGFVTGKLVLNFDVEAHSAPFSVTSNSFATLPAGVYIVNSNNESLKNYDRIVSLNGEMIADLTDYYNVIDQLKEGDTLTIVVSRPTSASFFDYVFTEFEVAVTAEVTKPVEQ